MLLAQCWDHWPLPWSATSSSRNSIFSHFVMLVRAIKSEEAWLLLNAQVAIALQRSAQHFAAMLTTTLLMGQNAISFMVGNPIHVWYCCVLKARQEAKAYALLSCLHR